jgi:hypothetical protein
VKQNAKIDKKKTGGNGVNQHRHRTTLKNHEYAYEILALTRTGAKKIAKYLFENAPKETASKATISSKLYRSEGLSTERIFTKCADLGLCIFTCRNDGIEIFFYEFGLTYKMKKSFYLPKRARHSALDVLRLLELAATSRLFSRQYRACHIVSIG